MKNSQGQRREEDAIIHFGYKNDPISFIENHGLGFNSSNYKFEVLPLFDFQKDIINFFHENKFSVTKKSRQMYLTTLAASYCAWKMLFSENYAIGIVGPKKESSIMFIEKIRIILQNYSNDYFHWEDDFVINNKSEIRLSNGCTIKAFADNVNCGRGYTINMYVIDEAAFMNLEVVVKNILPTALALVDSKLIIYSTPNGANFFNTIWSESIAGINKLAHKHVDWTQNPNYNKDMEIRDNKPWSPWYEERCKELGYDKSSITSELDGCFASELKSTSMRVNFRLKTDIYEKMINKINENSVSNYIRELIEKDLEQFDINKLVEGE